MKHLTRVSALVLLGALTALCTFNSPNSWKKQSTIICGEQKFSPSAASRLQAETAPLTFWRPIKGMGPTPLQPSAINQYPIEEDVQRGAHSYKEKEKEGVIVHDLPLETYLRTQLEELITEAPDYAKIFPIQIFLYRDPDHRNAFAAGGGYIFMSVDRVAHSHSEESLMHDLCHEWGHNALRHPTGYMTFMHVLFTQQSALGAQLNLDEVKEDPARYKLTVFALERMQRNEMDDLRLELHLNELAADVFAIQLLHKAGYDTSLVTKEYWLRAPHFECGLEYWDSHPHDATRALRMDLERDELADTPARVRRNNPSRFAAVQARARALIEGREPQPLLFIDSPAMPR